MILAGGRLDVISVFVRVWKESVDGDGAGWLLEPGFLSLHIQVSIMVGG